MAYIITNLTTQEVVLPSPVGITIPAGKGKTVNLTEVPTVTASDVKAIASTLNKLEQAETIAIQGVPDDVDSIAAAADDSFQQHPKDILANKAEAEVVKFNKRGGTPIAGGAAGGDGVEVWVMISDSDGTPRIMWENHDVTVTATGSGLVDGATSSVVTIVDGIGKFTVTDSVAETVTLSISGTAPVNPIFGTNLGMTDTVDVVFS